MDQDKKLERVDQTLADALGAIEAEMADIVAHYGSLLDPDATFERLDAQAGALCEAMSEVTDSIPDPGEVTPTDLGPVLRDCVSRSVEGLGFPLVVQTSIDEDLPKIEIAPLSIASALDRTLKVSADFAGHGGELRLQAHHEDDEIVLAVDALSGGKIDGAPTEYAPRLESVREFMTELGGGFEFEPDCDVSFVLTLRLPVGLAVG